MSYSLRRKLYEGLPDFLKTPVRWIPFSVWAGSSYRDTMANHALFEKADRGTIKAYQARELQRLLEFAVEQVPAYEHLKSAVGRLPPFEALKGFPLIDKETLQYEMPRYLPRNFDRMAHYECTTGGTTGNQLKFYLDDRSQSIETAFMHRQWSRVGYTPKSRKATFRGVEFRNLKEGVYWQANPIYNELQFSPYHMNESTLATYIEELFRYQPEYLHGYPSAITLLAEHVVRHNIDLRGLPLKAVLLGSEALEPVQRDLIKRAFITRPYSWYGHSERVILGGECERTEAYHHFPDYGILEVMDDHGVATTEPNSKGELVGTGLLNRSLPLIRYRTGDRARLLECGCTCGRQFDRFDQVEGRWKQEFIIGKSGSRISVAAMNIHGPFYDHVTRYQYHQKKPGEMELRLMISADFSEQDMNALKLAFAGRVGDELNITVKIVDDIPLTSRGKLRRLIQEIQTSNE